MNFSYIKFDKWYWLMPIFIFGVITGLIISCYLIRTPSSTNEVRLSGYKYTNPLLECDTANETNIEIRPFRTNLENFVNKQKSENIINDASVYYRDLNNGPWIGINEKLEFSPASMLKVPLMMAVLKKAETDPKILMEKIKIDKNIDNVLEQNFKPSTTVKVGGMYTVDELVYRMIVYSDNNAQMVLYNFIGDQATARTYSDLGLTVPDYEKTEDFMRIKDYASFFRVLFNASYLNKSFSERALESLTKVEFRNGLVAGVPEDIVVAHKFGERSAGEEMEKQLHDCGVVYYPDHPYLLCVMSRGQNFDKLKDFIKGISSLVYNEIDKQYKK